MPVQGTFRLENVGNLQARLRVTASVDEWKVIRDGLRTATFDPSIGAFISLLDQLITDAEQTFRDLEPTP